MFLGLCVPKYESDKWTVHAWCRKVAKFPVSNLPNSAAQLCSGGQLVMGSFARSMKWKQYFWAMSFANSTPDSQ